MILNSTKYRNPERTIIGLLNLVSNADTIILCDTSVGAVGIQLLAIPDDRWNTTYKIYIADNSNNASVNNITITAPIGFTINNQPSLVISTNAGTVLIRVASNTGYLGSLNSISAGSPIFVLDEGVIITPNATSLDFIGADVNATAIGGAVNITIQSNFVYLTYAQLSNLIVTNTLVPSQQYYVSDAIFLNTVPVEQVPIVIVAISTNEVSLDGSGIFLNADYQAIGDYSSVIGFVGQTGVYTIGGIYVIGDVVIWNNLHFMNQTGANGGDPISSPIDWLALAKSSTNGYIPEIDTIKYDVGINTITYREDVRNNHIENNYKTFPLSASMREAFLVFQWGNDNCSENVVSSESWFDTWNNFGQVFANTLTNMSFVRFDSIGNSGLLNGNIIDNYAQINVIENSGEMTDNNFFATQIQIFSTVVTASISHNVFKYGRNHVFTSNTPFSIIQKNAFVSMDTIVVRNHLVVTNNNFLFSDILFDNNEGTITNNHCEYGKITVLNNSGFITGNKLFVGGILIEQFGTTHIGELSDNTIEQGSSLILLGGSALDSSITKNSIRSSSILRILATFNRIITENEFNGGTLFEFDTIIAGVVPPLIKIANNVFNNTSFKFATTFVNIIGNNLTNCKYLIGGNLQGEFTNNIWVACEFLLPANHQRPLKNTQIHNASYSMPSFSFTIDGGIIQNNIGTTIFPLNMTDILIYDPATETLTIPIGLSSFIGEFWLFGGGGQTIRFILNSNPRYATKFINKDSATLINFQLNFPLALAPAESLISYDIAPITYVIEGRVNGEDSIYIRRIGNLNGVEQKYLYL